MAPGRPAAAAQPLTRFALAAGLAVCCAAVVWVPTARTQPPADAADDTPPLPPHDSRKYADLKWRPAGGKFRLDTAGKAIFEGRRNVKTGAITGGVEDDLPVASEKQNPDEAAAWAAVILHADQFTAADLEANSATDLTPDDLAHPSIRRHFRYELVRFDGTLVKYRRVTPTKGVADVGPKVLFEGILVPADESPATPVRVVFTAPPDGLPAPPAPAPGEAAGDWLTLDRWVTFAGYFFKYAAFAGPGADPADPRSAGWTRAPLLIGKSVTPLPGPPAEFARPQLPSRFRVFRMVRDDAPVSRDPNQWEEGAAWARAVLHARKFSAAELEAAAQPDVTFADLFQDSSRADYQYRLVTVRGRAVRIRRFEAPKRLQDAGIQYCYEAWVVPDNEPRGNPVCVVLTELPEGVEPATRMSLPVTVAGYSFKRIRYESGEASAKEPSKNLWKAAPLLIGRGLTVVGDPTADGPNVWVRGFIPVIVGGVVLMAGGAYLLSRWFRAGDQRARAEFEAARVKNPFTD